MVIFLSLGSNLGDRESHLRGAAVQLSRRPIELVRSASLYLTEPRDYAEQPWFLNTVIQATTELLPEDLLQQCLSVEREGGRIRTIPKGSRNIDIDIIFYDALIVETLGLTIPHPRYADRKFVLTPLMEIAPDFVDPRRGARVRDLFETSPDRSTVEIYGSPLF